jgi:peptidyl-prolyl cis-trans isomerase A (cyclophilin A)
MIKRLSLLFSSFALSLALVGCGGGVEVGIGGDFGGGGGGSNPPVPVPNPNPVPPTQSCSTAGLAAAAASKWPVVCMLTSSGEMVFELYDTYAPTTVANFLRYTADGFYANTLIHRVDRDFVFQGGGYKPGMIEKTATYGPIKSEANNGLSNLRGTLAMARRSDANSATSQWFVNVLDNTSLDYQNAANPGYTVFGRIISGLPVVDAINIVPVYRYSATDIEPQTEVLVYWVQRLK